MKTTQLLKACIYDDSSKAMKNGMLFISSKKLFLFSRYSIFVIFPIPLLSGFKRTNESGIIYDMNWLA